MRQPVKAYAMTGWRIGYAGGPLELIEAINTVQGQSTSHASSVSQYAALEALTGDQSCVEEARTVFEKRRNQVVASINAMSGGFCTSCSNSWPW